jgi:predicted metal-dependent HD superfamily phosphohydrolase
VSAATLERWLALWRQLELKGDGESVYRDLHAHYSEPHRHYHTLNHIADLLAGFDPAKALAQRPAAVELAIWFHDVIYDTHAADNEEKSAELARQRILETGGKPELADAVTALIMTTKTHDPALRPDAPLLVDLDLGIFGQSAERFDEYESQIRREYRWVPALIFDPKRAEILERFLARPRIYVTDHFSAKYEQPARINLQRSIRRLRGR